MRWALIPFGLNMFTYEPKQVHTRATFGVCDSKLLYLLSLLFALVFILSSSVCEYCLSIKLSSHKNISILENTHTMASFCLWSSCHSLSVSGNGFESNRPMTVLNLRRFCYFCESNFDFCFRLLIFLFHFSAPGGSVTAICLPPYT